MPTAAVAVIGFVGGLVFGAADFLGGLASRRIHPVLATGIAALTGCVALLLVTLALVGGVWSADALLWGALSGIAGALAISLLYACLAIGPMSILSPLTAVVSAIVPMSVGLASGETLESWGYAGLGMALLAVVLVGFIPEQGAVRPTLTGILMALGSGVMIGTFLILIDRAPADSGLIPLVVNRAVSAALMLLVLLGVLLAGRIRRRSALVTLDRGPQHARVAGALILAMSCGLVDSFANSLLLMGVRYGELSVMSVLTALYPAGTIVLAAVVLKERIAPVQIVGLVLAIAAAAMLAVA